METRLDRTLLVSVTLAMAAMVSGCGGSERRYSVNGMVLYQGKPAAGAAVHFRREGETPEEALTFPVGVVDAEGKYTLEAPGGGSGALPGKYRVLVLWPAVKGPDAPPARKSRESAASSRRDPKGDTDRLRYRYFHLDQPLLAAEVKPQSNTLDAFELKD